MAKNKIVFSASVASVKTLADNGIRVAFDLPEDAVAQAAALMQCKVDGIALRIEVMADDSHDGRGLSAEIQQRKIQNEHV
jgi:hypothetical protein